SIPATHHIHIRHPAETLKNLEDPLVRYGLARIDHVRTQSAVVVKKHERTPGALNQTLQRWFIHSQNLRLTALVPREHLQLFQKHFRPASARVFVDETQHMSEGFVVRTIILQGVS